MKYFKPDELHGVFTLAETETETDKKWLEKNCVEVFILQRDRNRRKFPLGCCTHFISICIDLGLGVGQS